METCGRRQCGVRDPRTALGNDAVSRSPAEACGYGLGSDSNPVLEIGNACGS